MGFGGLGEDVGAAGADEGFGGGADVGGAFGEGGAGEVGECLHGSDEAVAGEDGGGGDGGIGFGFVALDEFDLFAPGFEGIFDLVFGAELVGDGAGDVGVAGEEIFEDGGVAPGEEAVHGAHLFDHAVVGFGFEGNDFAVSRETGMEGAGDFADMDIGFDLFAVFDTEFAEEWIHFGGQEERGDDEGAEEIAFAAFVDADAGGGVSGQRVSGGCIRGGGGRGVEQGLQDEGFEDEFDPFGGFFSLGDEFPAFVEDEIEAVLFAGDGGVGDIAEVIAVVAEVLNEAVLGCGGEFVGEGGHEGLSCRNCGGKTIQKGEKKKRRQIGLTISDIILWRGCVESSRDVVFASCFSCPCVLLHRAGSAKETRGPLIFLGGMGWWGDGVLG